MMEWTKYSDKKPTVAGTYMWKVPHSQIDDLTVIFSGNMIMRGNGYADDILSPNFDHWDGYTVHVPKNLEWAEYTGSGLKSPHHHEDLSFIGQHISKCPFCKNTPKWKYHGRWITAAPHQSDYWYLVCCKWTSGFSHRLFDPRKIMEQRESAL
ncbi:MAG: hypothetical protein GY941_01090, partial [Planctomycetes bacterium]|nr:hypothetical protein [Planctomycetota bacterium]